MLHVTQALLTQALPLRLVLALSAAAHTKEKWQRRNLWKSGSRVLLECCCSTTLITMVHGQDKYTGTLDWNSNSRNCHAIILAHLVVSSDQLQQGSMLIVGGLGGGGGHMCIQHHHTTLLTIIHIPIRV